MKNQIELKKEEILNKINSNGSFVIPEDDQSFDEAIHDLLNNDVLTYSESFDDELIFKSAFSENKKRSRKNLTAKNFRQGFYNC